MIDRFLRLGYRIFKFLLEFLKKFHTNKSFVPIVQNNLIPYMPPLFCLLNNLDKICTVYEYPNMYYKTILEH